MVKNLNSTKGRLDLLTIYYGAKNFSRLQKVKSGVDPDYIFKFGMRVLPQGQYLYNEQAPEERNKGYLGKLGVGTKSILVYAEQFENQSDTSPGF